MTVAELIVKLKDEDPSAEVMFTYDSDVFEFSHFFPDWSHDDEQIPLLFIHLHDYTFSIALPSRRKRKKVLDIASKR